MKIPIFKGVILVKVFFFQNILKYILQPWFTMCDNDELLGQERQKEKKRKPPKSGAGRMGGAALAKPPPAKKEEKKRDDHQRQQGTKSSKKSSRRLLGELYSDKEYLEQLYKDGC